MTTHIMILKFDRMTVKIIINLIFLLLPTISLSKISFSNQNRLTYQDCIENLDLDSMHNFSMSKFAGKWFEIYSYPFCLTRKKF